MENKSLKENRLNNWVSLGFRLCMVVSIILVVVGLILTSITRTKVIEPMVPLNQIPDRILKLDVSAITTLGILVLLLTPIIQVVVAIINLSIHRDKLYLGISLALLCVLIFSLVLALI